MPHLKPPSKLAALEAITAELIAIDPPCTLAEMKREWQKHETAGPVRLISFSGATWAAWHEKGEVKCKELEIL